MLTDEFTDTALASIDVNINVQMDGGTGEYYLRFECVGIVATDIVWSLQADVNQVYFTPGPG